jgi:replicative DNA helicase
LEIDSDSSPQIQSKATTPPPMHEPPASLTVDYREYFKECNARVADTDYFSLRGISSDTVDRFVLGYDPAWKHPKAPIAVPTTARVIIPTGQYTFTARAIDPNANPRYAKQKVKGSDDVDGSPLFNAEVLKTDVDSSYIFIVEGEFDALSVMEVGGQAIALGSLSNSEKLIQAIENTPPTVPLVLSLDRDENEAGQKAQTGITNGLDALKIPFLQVNISGAYKDPNEHLKHDRATFAAYVADPQATEREQRKTAYMEKNAVVNCLNDFMGGINASVNTPAMPTGFNLLDDVLDGGLFEGLYILGALSSLGKTSFCLQIADQIAKQGTDVIIFSLEMSKYELISKTLSRLTIIADKEKNDRGYHYARTNRQITAGTKWSAYSQREIDLILKAVQTYGNEYASSLFIHEGIGDIGVERIKQEVQQHINFTGNVPIVVIDYLQILAPYDMRASDKQNTDMAVLQLKRMTRAFKIPVLAISSFNRDNYLSPVNMASFKESGAIEYSSDVLFGLQFEGMDEIRQTDSKKTENLKKIEDWKQAKPRKVQLKVLKNRNGATGASVYYDYYPQFNWFTERIDTKDL